MGLPISGQLRDFSCCFLLGFLDYANPHQARVWGLVVLGVSGFRVSGLTM